MAVTGSGTEADPFAGVTDKSGSSWDYKPNVLPTHVYISKGSVIRIRISGLEDQVSTSNTSIAYTSDAVEYEYSYTCFNLHAISEGDCSIINPNNKITVHVTASPIRVKISGQWRSARAIVKVDGQWREASPKIKAGGQWR